MLMRFRPRKSAHKVGLTGLDEYQDEGVTMKLPYQNKVAHSQTTTLLENRAGGLWPDMADYAMFIFAPAK